VLVSHPPARPSISPRSLHDALPIFTINKDGMMELLEPGRTAAFNTMFFDRYLWNLQFGQARIVPKARANGAAFTGVTISAGIPELDEAKELLDQLTADG